MKKLLLVAVLLILTSVSGWSQCSLNLSTTCICKNGGNNCDLLPDIIVSRPNLLINGSNGYVEYPPVCSPACGGNDGRLRISVSTPNIGHGPMETRGQSVWLCGTDTFLTYSQAPTTCPSTGLPPTQLIDQRIYHKSVDDTMRYTDVPAGTMTYHPTHGHQHVDNWGIYTLRTQTTNPDPLTWPIIGTGSKLAFCLLDIGSCNANSGYCVDSAGNTLNSTNMQNYGLGGGSYGCSNTVQGISAGFLDTYVQSLDGMWINLPAGLCNGTYWIVVQIDNLNLFREENENNNVMAVPVTLTQQSGTVPTVTTSGSTTFCTGGNVTLTCATAQNYLWSNGATTQAINVIQSGSYIVTVNTGTACASTSSAKTVTVTPFNVTATATPNATCPGDAVQLNSSAPSSGTINVATSFTNNSSVFIPDNNATGASSSVTVSGINPATLSSTSIVSVTLNLTHTYDGDLLIQLIAPSGNTINLSNRRGGSGHNFVSTVFSASAATAIASGGAPFTGSYTPDGAFSALTGNINGSWTLKVIDQANVDTGRVNNWTLTLNNSVPATLNYSWSSIPAGFNSTSQNPIANPTATSTYNINVTETGTGCSGTKTTTVTVGGNVHVTTNSPAPICTGTSTTLTASGATNYTWSPSIGLSATTGSSVTANPSATTTYRVVGNSSGCTDTAYITLTVTSIPVVTVNAPSLICAGTATTLNAGGANSYAWLPPTGLSATTGASVSASPASSTTYTVTGITNGCSSSSTVTVTVQALPSVSITADKNTVCSGLSAQLTASGATSYSWSPAASLNSSTGAVVTATPSITTVYTVTGTTNGCSSQTNSTINVITVPAITSSIAGTPSTCVPYSGTYSLTNVAGALSYNWTTPSGTTITGGQGTTSISVSSSTTSSGNICMIATNTCGSSNACMLFSAQTNAPVIPGSVAGSAKACPGETATLSVIPVARAFSYTWTLPTGVILLNGQGTNSIDLSFNQLFTGGNATVVASNGCGSSAARTKALSLNTPGVPFTISGETFGVCGTYQLYSVPSAIGCNYNWIVPAGCTVFGITRPDSNVVYIAFDATFVTGSIGVQAINSCGISSQRTKSVSAYPQQLGAVTGLTNVCTGQTGVAYSVTPIPTASSYSWTAPVGGTIAAGQGTNAVTVNFGTTAAIRTIYVRGHNDCGNGSTKSYPVNVTSCPKLSDDTAIDENGLSLYPNPAHNYVEVLFNTDKNANAELTLTDIIGKNLYSQKLTTHEGRNSYVINLKTLPSGIYLISLTNESNKFTKRLVIE